MTYALRIPTPSFHAPVVEDILALQQLKVQQLVGSTHPEIFFEIKGVFHVLESLGSARIEGNRTTIEEQARGVSCRQCSHHGNDLRAPVGCRAATAHR
jgi:hypothetical protein